MVVYFSGASISETRGINGKKGDQTGGEVRTCKAYNHKLGWRVFRAKSDNLAMWVAINSKSIADNNCFGYGQSDRNSGYNESKKVGWEPKKVKTPCNIDCSELVRTCIACALEKDIPDFNTSNEASVLLNNGFYEVKDWSLSTLQTGDILVTKTKGHTEVVSSGNDRKNVQVVATYYPAYKGNSKSISEALTSMGIVGSFTNRKKIAVANGISNYTGTATQNTKLLNLLKKGQLKRG